jgi:hypothetical protein
MIGLRDELGREYPCTEETETRNAFSILVGEHGSRPVGGLDVDRRRTMLKWIGLLEK